MIWAGNNLLLHSAHPHSQDKTTEQNIKYIKIHYINHTLQNYTNYKLDHVTEKPTSTMENWTTKQIMKQHQDISRLLRCMTNVNVIAVGNDLKTTQNTSCVYQKSQWEHKQHTMMLFILDKVDDLVSEILKKKDLWNTGRLELPSVQLYA